MATFILSFTRSILRESPPELYFVTQDLPIWPVTTVISMSSTTRQPLTLSWKRPRVPVKLFHRNLVRPLPSDVSRVPELSKKYENLIFLKVDVDEVQDVTSKWEVRAIPTFMVIKE